MERYSSRLSRVSTETPTTVRGQIPKSANKLALMGTRPGQPVFEGMTLNRYLPERLLDPIEPLRQFDSSALANLGGATGGLLE